MKTGDKVRPTRENLDCYTRGDTFEGVITEVEDADGLRLYYVLWEDGLDGCYLPDAIELVEG